MVSSFAFILVSKCFVSVYYSDRKNMWNVGQEDMKVSAFA